MTNSATVSTSLATLGAGGWTIAAPQLARNANTAPRLFYQVGDSLTSKGNYNVTATTVVLSNGIATITATSHGLFPGASVTLSCANEDQINGVWAVLDVQSSSQFTISMPAVGSFTATGTIQVINNQGIRDLNYFEIANAMLRHPFLLLRNVGKPGKTLAYIQAGFARDVLSKNPDGVKIQGGINDVIASASDGSDADAVLAAMIAPMKAMIAECVSRNIFTIVETVGPLGVARDANFAIKNRIVYRFNDWLKQYCQVVARSVFLLDTHRLWVNPTAAADGEWASGMSTDGAHPTAKATQAAGIELAALLASSYFLQRPKVGSGANAYTEHSSLNNVILNPLFETAGGTLTAAGAGSGAATNTSHAQLWTTTWTRAGLGTITSQLVARADGLGNDQQFTVNPADAGDQLSMLSNAMAARVTAGDIISAFLNLQISALAAVSNIFFSIDWSYNGLTYTQPCGMITGSDGQITTDFDWWLETLPFTLPGVPTTFRMRLTVAFSGAAANVIVKAGVPGLIKQTAYTAASI